MKELKKLKIRSHKFFVGPNLRDHINRTINVMILKYHLEYPLFDLTVENIENQIYKDLDNTYEKTRIK